MAKRASPPTNIPKHKRLHHHVARHYYAYMPNKKHHRVLVWVVFLLASLLIALQLLYPPDRALPFARITGENVAWQSHDELAAIIDGKFRATKLRLVTAQGTHVETTLASAGAEPASEAMISQLSNYPFWLRFVPLSVLWWQPHVDYSQHSFSASTLETYAVEQVTKLNSEPVSARLAIKDGRLQAEMEHDGSLVNQSDVVAQVADAVLVLGEKTEVKVPSVLVPPKRTAADFAGVKQLATAALARNVTIMAKDQSFTPSQKTLASWLLITEDKAGKLTLEVDTKAFDSYIDTINKAVAIPAGQTDIKLVDGREVSRSSGKVGDTVERKPLEDAVEAWLLRGEGQREFVASFVDVQPSVIYNSRYTSSQQGLQAYLNDLSKRMDVHVAVQQLGGAGEQWHASVRAGESIPSASTFKLYIATWLFSQMDKGAISWNDSILDTDVSTCFDRMTIASTNPCAYEWLRQLGRQNMDSFVHGLGFSNGTTFMAPDATHTTANDLLKMVIGIENSTYARGSNRDRLIHNLTIHPYRYGVPTGSKGQVYDKVGFLWDYVHDAAIVHHPKGNYAVVIMTKGQSYATIAGITREIEKIMYP